MKTFIRFAALGLALFPLAATAATSQVNYANINTTVKDNLGNPLTAGGNPNGDGAIIQIGYFSGSTATFTGNWIAISGLGSANPTLLTSVGDGGNSSNLGQFASGVTFDTVLNSSLPSGGTQLAMRFYNGTTISGSTYYNTVTSSNVNWQFKTPSTPAPLPAALDMDTSTLVWQGGSATAFTTAILIPEPATAMLGLVGGLLLLRRRRG